MKIGIRIVKLNSVHKISFQFVNEKWNFSFFVFTNIHAKLKP